MAKRKRFDLCELAAEVLRRSEHDSYVVRLSNPPTANERLQLLSARLQRKPIVVMPPRCRTIDEWHARYRTCSIHRCP